MPGHDRGSLPDVIKQKPLQAGKFLGILLSLVLGVAGFFRIVDVRALIDHPMLGVTWMSSCVSLNTST